MKHGDEKLSPPGNGRGAGRPRAHALDSHPPLAYATPGASWYRNGFEPFNSPKESASERAEVEIQQVTLHRVAENHVAVGEHRHFR